MSWRKRLPELGVCAARGRSRLDRENVPRLTSTGATLGILRIRTTLRAPDGCVQWEPRGTCEGPASGATETGPMPSGNCGDQLAAEFG